MSWEVNVSEFHRFNIVDDETRIEARRIKKYIQQFNHMNNLESMYIKLLRLAVDGKEIVVKDVSVTEMGNTYFLGKEGLGQRQVEHEQWDSDCELMQLLDHIENAKEIEFDIRFCIMRILGDDYGIEFWNHYQQDEASDSVKNNVIHKIIEYCDTDDEVFTYILDEKGVCEASFDNTEEDVKNIKHWFGNNFYISMVLEDSWEEHPKEKETLEKCAQTFFEKYNLLNEPELEDEEFQIAENLIVDSTQINELKDELQAMIDLGNVCKAEIELNAVFVSDDDDPFAIIQYELIDDSVIMQFSKF